MLALMDEKTHRIIFDTTERVGYAVRLRKMRTKETIADIITKALEAFLPNEIKAADALLASEDQQPIEEPPPAKPPHPKRGPKK